MAASVESTGEESEPEIDELVETGSVPPDLAFDILSNSRRRLVLHRLAECDGESTTSDLAEYVAAVENGKPVSELTSQERKRVYVGLYQGHLPKMDDADVLEVDDRGTVSFGPAADDVCQFLKTPDDEASEWPTYYAALTGVSTVALFATLLFFEAAIGPAFALSLAGYAALVALHVRSEGAEKALPG